MTKKQNFLTEACTDSVKLFAYYVCKYYNWFKYKLDKFKKWKNKL